MKLAAECRRTWQNVGDGCWQTEVYRWPCKLAQCW